MTQTTKKKKKNYWNVSENQGHIIKQREFDFLLLLNQLLFGI